MRDPWLDDDRLLDDLAVALDERFEADPAIVAAAKQAYAWRTVDEELAALTYDSAMDEELLSAVRATGGMRMLTFQSPSCTIELGVGDDSLTGQLVPPREGSVELRTQNAVVTVVEADEMGFFTIGAPPPHEAVSLRYRIGDGATVVTSWIRLRS